MENLKNNKELGLGFILLSIIVGVLAYDGGKTSGIYEGKSTFLDSAYISSCDDKGEYCYIDTNDGEKEVACDKNNKCFMMPKTAEELKKQKEMDDKINELINSKEYKDIIK